MLFELPLPRVDNGRAGRPIPAPITPRMAYSAPMPGNPLRAPTLPTSGNPGMPLPPGLPIHGPLPIHIATTGDNNGQINYVRPAWQGAATISTRPVYIGPTFQPSAPGEHFLFGIRR